MRAPLQCLHAWLAGHTARFAATEARVKCVSRLEVILRRGLVDGAGVLVSGAQRGTFGMRHAGQDTPAGGLLVCRELVHRANTRECNTLTRR